MSPTARVSRRGVLKKIAVAASVLPLIMSVATKTAAQSMSGGDDPSTTSSSPAVNVNVTVVEQGNQSKSTPCRSKGQSCVAAASGQQGTCCAGLSCTGVSQNAGVCG